MVLPIDVSLASFANATTLALNKADEEDTLNKEIADAPEHTSKRTDIVAHNIRFFISKI